MRTNCKLFYTREEFTNIFRRGAEKKLFQRDSVQKVYKREKQNLIFREVKPCGN